MYHSPSPPLAKPQIRECSRNSPTIERTADAGRQALHAWQQRAGSPGDDVDPNALLRGAVQGFDRRLVDERVELDDDPRLMAEGLGMVDLAVDELEEPRAQAVRRDEQPPERPLARQAGQDVEQVRDVGAELRPAAQQPEVGVQAGGPRVVVAGPDVDVAPQAGALAPDDQAHLRVRLEPDEPVDDVGARLLELARPDDVRLLVEAGLDLDENDDLLAALGGADEVAARSASRRTSGTASS